MKPFLYFLYISSSMHLFNHSASIYQPPTICSLHVDKGFMLFAIMPIFLSKLMLPFSSSIQILALKYNFPRFDRVLMNKSDHW